ncbi:MAG: tRNA dihydrouridine(20/20a) synthase DusA [Rhodospirillaceae bacterium]|nr:tRNA dihydrouridine(20/20a) synthase DusA [Rhodospirillaceae bacterium]MBT3925608.1 tRNA dihydrouridine(20/20a) synthase DusA [Rhodospirillaceae bacterium]MBT5778334.1 tRNA dihydrouridine(20/20a) synthase DusA [Rhodospirillaceae bacterium]
MANFSVTERRLSVAPMMECTDRHGRYFLRQISRNILLYSEMITAAALVHGKRDDLLAYDAAEHPLALQLGGSDPAELALAAKYGEAAGYGEINLNVGCPSDRVKSGRFGACLMAEPELVARCVAAMAAAVEIPVTVKCRTGIDGHDSFELLRAFAGKMVEAGMASLAVHSRIAILEGLSPKQNREIPPLNYARVYRLKEELPALEIILNGGVRSLGDALAHLERVDGVMIGRAAFDDPYILAEADQRLFSDSHAMPSRHDIARAMLPYIERALSKGARLNHITRHMLGLFHARPGARAWRRYLSENVPLAGAGPETVEQALARVPEAD